MKDCAKRKCEDPPSFQLLETKGIGNRIASSTLYRVHISIVIILEALEGHIIYLGR